MLVAPETATPFTFHCQAGVVPPFVGVAVQVTLVPWQTGFAEAVIETLTGTVVGQEPDTSTSSTHMPYPYLALPSKAM
jgi:hypothetical protein